MEESLQHGGGETLEQKSCGCSIGWGFWQHDLMKDVPANGRAAKQCAEFCPGLQLSGCARSCVTHTSVSCCLQGARASLPRSSQGRTLSPGCAVGASLETCR